MTTENVQQATADELRILKLKRPLPIDTLYIGLDVSIDSLGLSMVFGELVVGFLIVPKLPPLDDSCPNLNYVEYRKQYDQHSYSAKERSKMMTRRTLANKVEDSIQKVMSYIYPAQPKYVRIAVEGPAYGYTKFNSNSVVDLNEYRSLIVDRVYHMWPLGQSMSYDTLAPKSLKKEATGNGSADKLAMIESAIAKLVDITWCGKIDDFADALHLATSNSLSATEPRLW